MTEISGKLINRLASVLHEARPDWQEPGILDALTKATSLPRCVDGFALVVASARAANDGKNRTPAVIALDGKHWHEVAPASPTTDRLPSSVPWACCAKCGLGHHVDAPCERKASPGVAAAALAAMRALPRRPVEVFVPPAEEMAS